MAAVELGASTKTVALIRSFFALSLPEVSVTSLNRAAKRCQALLAAESLRWLPLQNYHVTLAFLGNISQDDLPRLHSIASRTVEHRTSMDLNLTEVAWFPSAFKPKVLAAMIEPNEELAGLHRSLVQQLQRYGYRVEGRRFHPHITLARVNRNASASQFPECKLDIPLPINELVLFASKLKANGPIYSPLFELLLGS